MGLTCTKISTIPLPPFLAPFFALRLRLDGGQDQSVTKKNPTFYFFLFSYGLIGPKKIGFTSPFPPF